MKGINTGMWLVAWMVAASAGAATLSSLPEPDAFAKSILSGKTDLETFDFDGAGYWKLDEAHRLPWLGGVQQGTEKVLMAGVAPDTCSLDDRRRFAAALWLMVLQKSPDAATWRESHSSLQKGLATVDESIRTAEAGAKSSTDPRLSELYRRGARDQAIRDMRKFQELGEGMPPIASQQWMGMPLTRMIAIDCENTAWLRAQLHEVGWFDIPRFGARADKEAWTLVQHADRDPAFQRDVLARLQALPPGNTDPHNIALLYDRVARAEGRPQRYGTQGTCLPDGTWEMQETEAPAELDARRKSVGLMPMAEYRKVFVGVCPRTAK